MLTRVIPVIIGTKFVVMICDGIEKYRKNLEKIALLVREKKIEGISDIRDESNKEEERSEADGQGPKAG